MCLLFLERNIYTMFHTLNYMRKYTVVLIVIFVMIGLNIYLGYFAFGASPDYSLTAAPSVYSVYQGGSFTYNLTLASLRNFGFQVAINATAKPEGVDVILQNETSLKNAVFQLKGNQNLTTTATVNVDPKAPAGLYDIVIEAKGGGLTHSITSQVNIIGTGQIVIIIKNFWFYPNNVTLKKGSEVVWINQDLTGHTATSDSGIFDTKILQQNQASVIVSFDEVGKYSYYCTPHPQMIGVINVVD